MSYIWQRWIADALRAEGVTVIEETGWKNRGRYRADGKTTGTPNWNFNPDQGFIWHHTGSTSSTSKPFPTKTILIKGRSDLPGPLCQVAPDYLGRVHVVAAGRANHAGPMKYKGGLWGDRVDGNAITMGCEIDYNGTQAPSSAQYTASIKAAAAWCRHFNRNEKRVFGHAETSTTGKWDPGTKGKTVNLDAWRADLKECLSYPPGVWRDPRGTNSWGVVRVAHLSRYANRKNPAGTAASIKRFQWRLQRSTSIKPELAKAVKITGVWDAQTTAAWKAWQQKNAAKRVAPYYGLGTTNAMADKFFGPRFHVIKK